MLIGIIILQTSVIVLLLGILMSKPKASKDAEVSEVLSQQLEHALYQKAEDMAKSAEEELRKVVVTFDQRLDGMIKQLGNEAESNMLIVQRQAAADHLQRLQAEVETLAVKLEKRADEITSKLVASKLESMLQPTDHHRLTKRLIEEAVFTT